MSSSSMVTEDSVPSSHGPASMSSAVPASSASHRGGASSSSSSSSAAGAGPSPAASSSSSSSLSHFPSSRPPSWLMTREELVNSPSFLDGMSADVEHTIRKSTCVEVSAMGLRLGLKKEAIAAATMFLQRFFSRRSLLKHDRMAIAVACLMIAGKTTDFTLPLRLDKAVPEYLAHCGHRGGPINERTEVWVNAKEKLVQAERLVLYVIEYDVDMDTPPRHVDAACKEMGLSHEDVLYTGAVRCMNEALRTTLGVQYDARTLALGSIAYAADRLAKNKYVRPEKWQEVVESHISPAAIADIGFQLKETVAMTKKALADGAAAAAAASAPAGAASSSNEGAAAAAAVAGESSQGAMTMETPG